MIMAQNHGNYQKSSPKKTRDGCGRGGSKVGKTNTKGSNVRYGGQGGPKRRKH